MIGGGIGRRVCDFCGAVTIDLTEAEKPTGAELDPTETSHEHARGS